MTRIDVYRIQVNRFGNWINIGKPCRTKEAAQSWKTFVRAAWHGLPVRVTKMSVELPTVPQARNADPCEKSS